ncbi:signal transduction histidine kinase [Actinomycetospora succinea]|uniref:histidine kinase n=1 Tax=Actinomycetospora succinea TaxID=663603 RepID=A0A4R6VNX8_9PSEU|nr:histidine kinase [Actinomycetospora succinea]TDQ65723.1 signal transduction histidine kinase [Actinomycetospora succinea]
MRRNRWSYAGRIVLAGILLAIAWPTSLNELAVTPATALAVALVVALPVLVAPEHPWRAWVASALGGVLIALLVGAAPGYALSVQAVHLVVLCGLTALVVARCAPWAAAVATAGLVGLFVLATRTTEGAGLGIFFTVVVLAVGLLGRRVLTQRRQIVEAEEQRADEESRRAVLQERARVARDLHDVVAHSMSMVVVRAETARYRLPAVDAASAEEFTAIGDAARAALTELRGVLTVLRADDDAADLTPQPGADDVDELLAATSAAGVELTVTTTGDPAGLGPAASVSLYRILAEALANASRHAADVPVAVTIDHTPDTVRLRVVNGPGRSAAGPGSGLGLPGMRERAAAVDGALTVGPTGDGGFAVDASLPAGRATLSRVSGP